MIRLHNGVAIVAGSKERGVSFISFVLCCVVLCLLVCLFVCYLNFMQLEYRLREAARTVQTIFSLDAMQEIKSRR